MAVLITSAGSKPSMYCVKAGKVLVVGSNLGYEGNYVIVEYVGGFVTYYGHFDSVNVTYGQQVTNETVLGITGQTGLATGIHLHFEVRQGGSSANSRINPRDVINV
ncbi:M23 family metallopeptidase [Enterococcus crotali]|uniref:M23 family metallopeptidase n=1 Tax=Enterococcus crotali TaxID=1453587 RepID=UPI0009E22365|nr:M23 family metallopeptidase [Enterococcus crotali]